MRIHRIRLQHVAGVEDREITLADGVTVVVGPNEAGKSTIALALTLLLEEKDRYDNERIRAVRPVHADTDPTIELECTTGPYHVTYRKVFGRTAHRRETTLVVHEPEPASLAGDAAHDRMTAILEETVDDQLWGALRVQQRHDVGQADLAEVGSLMAAIDAAGGGVDPVADDDSLVARVEEEAATFWTATGRPRKPLLESAARVEQARSSLEAAQAQLDDARQAAERHDAVVARIDTWRTSLPDLERRAKETAAAVTALRAERTAVDELARRAEAADDAAVRARDLLADREALVARLTRARSAADDGRAAAATAERRRRSAAEQVAEARELRDTLRRELGDARTRLRAAEDDVALLRDHRDRELLAARIAEAEQLHAEREDARARLDAGAPSPAVVRRLERLEEQVRTARALRDAGVPHVRVDGPADAAVRLDDTAVNLGGEDVELPITRATTVTVGAVTVTITPGASATDLADRLADAEHELRRALEDAGVADLAAARRRRELAVAAQRELEATEASWARVTGVDGLDGLRAALARTSERLDRQRAARPGDRPVPPDRDAADEAVAARRAEVEEAEAAARTAEAALEAAVETATAAGAHAARTIARRDDLRDRLGEVEEALEAAREDVTDAQLAAAVAEAERTAAAAATAHSDAATALARTEVATVEADAEAAGARLDTTRRQLQEAEVERAQVWGRIEASAADGLGERVEGLESALAEVSAQHDRLEHRAAALKLLRDTLHAHRDDARTRYRAPLRARIEQLGRVVFGRSFSVTLDDQLRVAERTLDGRTLSVDQLSGGAQEQLAIIGRLATASLVDPGDGVPLILDDALGYADPARADRMTTLLADVGEHSQVLVLTCDPQRFTAIRGARIVSLE